MSYNYRSQYATRKPVVKPAPVTAWALFQDLRTGECAAVPAIEASKYAAEFSRNWQQVRATGDSDEGAGYAVGFVRKLESARRYRLDRYGMWDLAK